MTNDLAIRILNGDILGTTEQTHEAVAMAVKALSALPSEQPDVPDIRVGDMISRQAAIKAFKNFLAIHDSRGVEHLCSAVTMDGVNKILSDLPSADVDLSGFSDKLWKTAYERGKAEAVRWISCSERLPAKKTEVIYSLENRYVSTGYMTDIDYNGDEMELHWEDMESGALIYPEAWMPLPKPYEGSE